MKKIESTFKPMSGYVGLLLMLILGIGGIVLGLMLKNPVIIILAALTFIFISIGLTAISPNGRRVLCSDKAASPIVNAGTLHN